MASKNNKRKDTGLILLGFATLMFGMQTMTGAVAGLKDVPEFGQLLIAFTNPVLGLLAGAALTALIHSSSASVGSLQALASTAAVTYGAAIPIIMGQNIGTCITTIISSIGANRNAKRAALVHLSFNVIGSAVWLTVFCVVKAVASPVILSQPASLMGIAVIHSIFNVLCTLLLLPFSGMLEKLVCRLIPDAKAPEKIEELDERLLESPALALNRCQQVIEHMAAITVSAIEDSLAVVLKYDREKAERIRQAEAETDALEDLIGTYLLKLTARSISEEESAKATEYLKLIGDYERMADHAVNILESAEEIKNNALTFSESARSEFRKLGDAVTEIVNLSYRAFSHNDAAAARQTEALEQVIDDLKEELRTRHIIRMQKRECSASAGFVWSDLLTNLERVADHCSNISLSVLDLQKRNMKSHENQHHVVDSDEDFTAQYNAYSQKYHV